MKIASVQMFDELGNLFDQQLKKHMMDTKAKSKKGSLADQNHRYPVE